MAAHGHFWRPVGAIAHASTLASRDDHRQYRFASANLARSTAQVGVGKAVTGAPPPPDPAAAAAGKFNSSTTRTRVPCGLGYVLVTRTPGSPTTQRVGSPIEFPRRLRGASTCAPSRVRISAGNNDAQVFGSALRPRVVRWGWGREDAKNPKLKPHHSVVPGESNPPGR